MTIPEVLRARRLELSYSQKELALLTGLDAGNISRLENSVISPTLDSASRLSAALQIPPQVFFAPHINTELNFIIPSLNEILSTNSNVITFSDLDKFIVEFNKNLEIGEILAGYLTDITKAWVDEAGKSEKFSKIYTYKDIVDLAYRPYPTFLDIKYCEIIDPAILHRIYTSSGLLIVDDLKPLLTKNLKFPNQAERMEWDVFIKSDNQPVIIQTKGSNSQRQALLDQVIDQVSDIERLRRMRPEDLVKISRDFGFSDFTWFGYVWSVLDFEFSIYTASSRLENTWTFNDYRAAKLIIFIDRWMRGLLKRPDWVSEFRSRIEVNVRK